MYDKYMELFDTLSEAHKFDTMDKVEDFVRTNPYIFSQAIVSSLIGAKRNGISGEQFYLDLNREVYGRNVLERLKNAPCPHNSYLHMGQNVMMNGFAIEWPKVVSALYNLDHANDSDIRNAVAKEPGKLADLSSIELNSKVIEPLKKEFS